jgi:hypothetical protein
MTEIHIHTLRHLILLTSKDIFFQEYWTSLNKYKKKKKTIYSRLANSKVQSPIHKCCVLFLMAFLSIERNVGYSKIILIQKCGD